MGQRLSGSTEGKAIITILSALWVVVKLVKQNTK
jgi:hypothetical protein